MRLLFFPVTMQERGQIHLLKPPPAPYAPSSAPPPPLSTAPWPRRSVRACPVPNERGEVHLHPPQK